jgi:hypothetical protein
VETSTILSCYLANRSFEHCPLLVKGQCRVDSPCMFKYPNQKKIKGENMKIVKKTLAKVETGKVSETGMKELLASVVSGINSLTLQNKGNEELLAKINQSLMILSQRVNNAEKSMSSLETRISDGIATFLRHAKAPASTPASTPAATPAATTTGEPRKAGRPAKWIALANASNLDMVVASEFVKALLAESAEGTTSEDIDLAETAKEFFGKNVPKDFLEAVSRKCFPED